jgi:hypothetical protein
MTDKPAGERPRGWAIAVTILTAIAEWLLFELVRLPYRPPYDMTTLLGTEKYTVLDVMYIIAGGWLACLVIIRWVHGPFTRREYAAFGAVLIMLAIVIGLLVWHPLWRVTPFDLILH